MITQNSNKRQKIINSNKKIINSDLCDYHLCLTDNSLVERKFTDNK